MISVASSREPCMCKSGGYGVVDGLTEGSVNEARHENEKRGKILFFMHGVASINVVVHLVSFSPRAFNYHVHRHA